MISDPLPGLIRTTDTELPSLKLVLKLTREELQYQRDRAKALDTKANFVLGSASIVTGLSTLQTNVLPTNFHLLGPNGPFPSGFRSILPYLEAGLTIFVMLAFVVVVILAYQGYKIRTFVTAPDPEELQHYPVAPLRETREEVLGELVRTFNDTEVKLSIKARWVAWGLRIFVFEGFMLTLLVTLRTVM